MIARRGPKYPKKGKNLRPKAKNRKTKTRRTERNRATTTSGHHGQAVVDTKARGGRHGLTVVSPTAVVEVASPGCAVFFRVPLRLPAVFALFCLYICHVSEHIEHPIHSHLAFYLHHSFRVVFRERKKERRRTARILHWAWRSKDGSAHLDELFFFFYTLFSI